MDDKAPFAVDGPVDLNAKFNDRKGQPASWKEAPIEAGGIIDLGNLYSREAPQAAFGYTEIDSPSARTAKMAVRSDDTLTVWLNGKQVYDFQGNRSAVNPDLLDVALAAGANRVVVKCGNRDGIWQFGVALDRPIEGFRPVEGWQVVGVMEPREGGPLRRRQARRPGRQARRSQGPARRVEAHQARQCARGLDLVAHFSVDAQNTDAYGYAEVRSPAARKARMMIGSNDFLTVWLNGKQVYRWQAPRAWAPDHALIDVPLAEGVNRIVALCGNNGGPWMYSIALDETSASKEPEALAQDKPPTPERLREALPALQVEARAALERLSQKVEGKTPADDRAAELAADQRDAQADAAKNPANDPEARAAEAADQRRIANALRNLDAPDASLARAEAVHRAEKAADALADPAKDPEAAREAVAEAAHAADALARRLADEQSPARRAEAPARAQRDLNGPEAPADPAALARQQHAIADELALLPVDRKANAAEAVAHAAALADRAAKPDQNPRDRPDPAAAAEARAAAAKALDNLAARQIPDPADGPPKAVAEALARAERALADDLKAAHDRAEAAKQGKPDDPNALARLDADLAPLAARQQALANVARNLPEAADPKPGDAHPGDAKPGDPKPGDAKPGDAHPGDSKPGDPKPGDAHPGDAHPGDAKPGDAKPSDPKPGDAKPGSGQPHPLAEAKAAQGRAAEAMAKHDPANAAAGAKEAAEALDRLANALPAEAPPHPQGEAVAANHPQGEHAGNGEHPAQDPAQAQAGKPGALPDDPALGVKAGDAAEAASLARRERHIREQVQAILGERVKPQQDLRDQAAALGRELADLRDRSKETSPRAQVPAQAAAQLLGEAAPQAMDRAAEGLHQGHPDAAKDAQRQAADLVEQAARHAEDMAAALRADRPADAPDAGQGDLAAAQAAQREAAQQLAQARAPSQPAGQADHAAEAARSMHQAAQGLRAASQPPAGPPQMAEAKEGDSPSKHSETPSEPKGKRAGKADADLAELQAALKAKTGRAWGELPGHLRTEILQMSQGRYRDDYSRLIQLYFREIAAGAPDRGAQP